MKIKLPGSAALTITAASLLCACFAGESGVSGGTEITVFAAASLNKSMEEIAADYSRENPDTRITINADSSGKLKTQIEEGADCDIFISAANAQMEELEAKGMISDARKLLTNRVVLIKPKGARTDVLSFETVTQAKSIALADESVPAGAYAREIFRAVGNYDNVMNMTINECSNVTNVLSAVSEGANEVGVVYATDAASMPDSVEIIAEASDELLSSPVVYPMGAVIKPDGSGITEAAREFMEYLSGDGAAAVFEKNGFGVK